jgi:hypothetical protein
MFPQCPENQDKKAAIQTNSEIHQMLESVNKGLGGKKGNREKMENLIREMKIRKEPNRESINKK